MTAEGFLWTVDEIMAWSGLTRQQILLEMLHERLPHRYRTVQGQWQAVSTPQQLDAWATRRLTEAGR